MWISGDGGVNCILTVYIQNNAQPRDVVVQIEKFRRSSRERSSTETFSSESMYSNAAEINAGG
jgi:hypothetical protein